MITLNLYKCADDPRVISKTLTNQISMSGTLRESCSVISPVITLENNTNISDYNYAYIPEFGRYYYITDITAITNKSWQIKLSVDVRKTYDTELRNIDVITNRAEKNANYYLNDNKLIQESYENVLTRQFTGNPFGFDGSNRHYIFITTGG